MANPYTWTEPVTTRSSGSERMTYEDMNRITRNIAFLYNECVDRGITISGSEISKTDWIRNDILTTTFWAELLTCLTNVREAIRYTPPTNPDDAMQYENINNVERICYYVYNVLFSYEDLARMNHWVGDKLADGDYLRADDGFNAGGRYD